MLAAVCVIKMGELVNASVEEAISSAVVEIWIFVVAVACVLVTLALVIDASFDDAISALVVETRLSVVVEAFAVKMAALVDAITSAVVGNWLSVDVGTCVLTTLVLDDDPLDDSISAAVFKT